MKSAVRAGAGLVIAAAALSLASLLLIAPARGASLRALTLVELVDGSDQVVLGIARRVVSRRAGSGRIVRHVTVEVERYLVGGGPRMVTVQLLGGELNGAATRVPGEAVLEVGSRDVLFLERLTGNAEPLYRVRGMAQGRFAVTTDAGSGLELVSREIGALVGPATPAGGGVHGLARGESCYCTTLEHFESMVRAAAGQRRASPGE